LNQNFIRKIRSCFYVLTFGAFACACAAEKVKKMGPPEMINPHEIIWYVLDVSDQQNQADANLLIFGSGEVVLVDAGQTTNLLAAKIKRLGVSRIDKILVSHAHKDHYGGILDLLDSGVNIGAVYLKIPPKAICDLELPWGCNHADLLKLQNSLEKMSIPIRESKAGDIYVNNTNFNLKALYAHDGLSPPVGNTDINDMSVILSLSAGSTKALFTGDLNQKFGSYLALSRDNNLKAQLLKVPHHGTDSLAPNSFFEWVNPKAAFVPAPLALWLSERSTRARTWFLEQKIPTFVTGASGMIKVIISQEDYEIIPES
jgi:competence protein ComEC